MTSRLSSARTAALSVANGSMEEWRTPAHAPPSSSPVEVGLPERFIVCQKRCYCSRIVILTILEGKRARPSLLHCSINDSEPVVLGL